ncbi:MAG: hypothetical protein OXG44_02380 [Gammaproteobacteria bacterium]|nr:hypothetical protein [Gammaproteobacteria bacterium]
MATRTLIGLAGLAAGVVIGLALAWVAQHRDAPAPVRATAADLRAPALLDTGGPVATTLEDTLRLPGNFRQTAALYELLADADIPTLERVLAESGTLASRQDATAARTIIYSRFVELDAERALADVLARGGPEQERHVETVFAHWAEIDQDAALDKAETLPQRQRRAAAVAVLTARDDLPEIEQRAIAMRFSIEPVLARLRAETTMHSDPAVAWRDALAQMSAGQEQNAVLRRIAQEWIDGDPHAAMAAVAAMPDQTTGRYLRRALVRHWMEADPDAAIAWALTEPASPQRDTLLADAAEFLAQTSPRQALQIAAGLDATGKRRVIVVTLVAWAQDDPEAAIKAVAEVDDAEVAEALYWELASIWAGRNPGAAATWLASSDLAGEPQRRALRGVLVRWAGDDPQAAASWLETAPQNLRERHIGHVLHPFARQDARGAFALLWSQGVETRRRSVGPLMDSIAYHSPTVALDLFAGIRDAQARTQAMEGILQGWSQSDPERAARYLLGPGAEFLSLMPSPVAAWVAVDPTAAVAFIDEVPPGPERDAATWVAIAQLVEHDASLADAALAEDLYAGIEDAESRTRAADALAGHFEDYDEERAEQYRAAAGIDR